MSEAKRGPVRVLVVDGDGEPLADFGDAWVQGGDTLRLQLRGIERLPLGAVDATVDLGDPEPHDASVGDGGGWREAVRQAAARGGDLGRTMLANLVDPATSWETSAACVCGWSVEGLSAPRCTLAYVEHRLRGCDRVPSGEHPHVATVQALADVVRELLARVEALEKGGRW